MTTFFKCSMAVFTIFAGTILFSGCSKSKSGCTDANADNFDSNAEENSGCEYRYAQPFYVRNKPATKPGGVAWDANINYDSDVYVRFKPVSATAWNYTKIAISITATAPCDQLDPAYTIKFTNEEWEYEIYDCDSTANMGNGGVKGVDEIMDKGKINPFSQGTAGNSGSINVTGENGMTIEMTYGIKK